MAYMRMQESKFWGWVITSLVIGLAVGLGGMYLFTQAAAASKVEAAKTELSGQITDANAKATALEARLASTEASLAALTEANAVLTAELETAKADAEVAPSSNNGSTLAVTMREIQPDSVTASETITMTAKVTGSPDKVTMKVKAKSGSYDETFALKKVSTSGSTETWKANGKAPAKGTYTYYATAIKGDKTATMEGASPSTLTVK